MKQRSAFCVAIAVFACTANEHHAATDASTSKTTRTATVADTGARVDTIGAVTPSGSAESPPPRFEVYYDKPIDSKYALVLTRVRDSLSRVVGLQVRLLNAGNRQLAWDVATLPASDFGLKVLRADSTSIVFSRDGDYGQEMSVKFFLDPDSKKITKRVDFSPWAGLDSISDHDAAIALAVPDSVVKGLKLRDPRPAPGEPWDKYLPQVLKDHPMPGSTYAEFARARPNRVQDGYDSTSGIGEMPGPLQVDGSRIWFGKTFYDGEGTSGVGGVGYFDTIKSKYTFLKIPELAAWSVSSLFLDDQILWVGLVGHPEGSDYSGGLLRHDLKTGDTRKYPINDVVLRITRWNGRVYLTTAGGASVIEGAQLIARYLSEPDPSGKFVLSRVNP